MEKKRMYVAYCDYTDLHGVYCQSLDEAVEVIKGDMADLTDKELADNVIEYRIHMPLMSQTAINKLGEYEP